MAVDLNKLSQKMQQQRNVGIDRDGRPTDKDPRNDGSKDSRDGLTTLKPQRFFT